jgi:hypothetical protein
MAYLVLAFALRFLMGDVVHAATTNTTATDPKYVRDFVEYWAASRLLLTGNNPYGPQELFELQRSVGWKDSIPLLMWNPPWTLSFTVPFGLASFDVAQLLWLLFNTLIILFALKNCGFFTAAHLRPTGGHGLSCSPLSRRISS